MARRPDSKKRSAFVPEITRNRYVLPETSRAVLIAVRDHPAGKSLASQQRWPRFRHPSEDPGYWRSALGPTIDILAHQPYFANFAIDVLRLSNWPKTNGINYRTLILACLVHDVGEAKLELNGNMIGVGDVAAPNKTQSIEKEEHRIAMMLLEQLKLEEPVKKELKSAYHTVVMGESETLHVLFKALEKLEYLDTAMTAYIRVIQEDEGSWNFTIVQDWNLIAGVLAWDFEKFLREYYPKFPSIFKPYLLSKVQLLDDMFEYVESRVKFFIDSIDELPDDDSICGKKRAKALEEKFPAVATAWKTWKEQNDRFRREPKVRTRGRINYSR